MAKKRIQNYVFLPGVAKSSNAYPNAYSLIESNLNFIKKEAVAYISSRITTETASNNFPNAVTLLTNNKTFLQDEITAWIAAQVTAGTPPFSGYTYDATKCKRDVGYIIDAYITDVRYGGNKNTIKVIKQYWLGGVAQVDGDRTPEVAAHNKLRDIINNNILPKVAYVSQQSPVTSTQSTAGTAGEAGTSTLITSLASIVTGVIANGLSVLPTENGGILPFAGYIYDSAKCERDVNYVLNAYLYDLRYGGNTKIRLIASRYWEGGVPQIDGNRSPEIETHQFIEDLINDYILPQAAYSAPYQTDFPIVRNGSVTYEGANATSRITALRTLLTDVITGGLSVIPAQTGGPTTIRIQGKHDLDELLLITNVTSNVILYNFSDPDAGAVVSQNDMYNSNGNYRDEDFPTFLQTADYVTTIIFDIDTSDCAATDDIQIFVEPDELKIRPYDFGTDAIERMRVALPQSMLDADFEYGLQPTKWQAIGISRGYPAVYEVPGTDTQVVNVVTDASTGTSGVGESLITVTTVGPHGFTVGTPFTIKSLANSISGFSRAEGTFIVNTVPTTLTFTYYAQSKVGTSNGQILATTYTQLRKASFYTGASLGQPSFTVASNGAITTFDTQYITTSGSDQIAFTGTVPAIGSPLSGTGIGSGAQVTGVVGDGGSGISKDIALPVAINDTSFEVTDSTGILEGMAVDNGTGTSTFVAGIEGNVISFTAPFTATKVGGVETYLNVSGTNISPIGVDAEFSIERVDGQYANILVTTAGTDYRISDRITVLGTDLGGATPANDLLITVADIDVDGGITDVVYSGTSVSGDNTFVNISADGGSGSGTLATFNITRSAGVYTTVPVVLGQDYQVGDTLTVYGTQLEGLSPANDLTITVTDVDVDGGILTVSSAGTAISSDDSFTALSGTNVEPVGAGATFDITRTDGVYSAIINQDGSGYFEGEQILVDGTELGGLTSTNDATITISAVALGGISSITIDGTAVPADTVDFYSAVTFSELTTASIPDGTTITASPIAVMQVSFATAHGLVPGASVLIDISSTGTNHGLARGPFYVESVPSLTTFRYTARAAGTVDTVTNLSGTVYTRPDSYFIHRPYDGGVQLGTGGPQHGAQAIRMSKKYIRYQSGKGIMYTTGALFAPSYNLQSLTATGTSIGSYITLTTDDVDHGCQVGGVIKIIGVETAGYNGTYTITDIITERTLRVQAQTLLANVYATISANAQMSVQRWHGATVRAGTFDDQNGMFWQYDGRDLAIGRRSSTFQMAGVVDITRDTNLMVGTNTRFRDQCKAGDRVVIKGMTHVVTNVISQTQMTVNPDYRGTSNAVQAKLCLVQDLIVKQSQWNMDRLDGTGPSGYVVDISKMQMIGMQWSWYGAGFIDFMLRGSDGNYIFVHRIRNSNVNTEAYMRTGNMPVRYEVINESANSKLLSSITAAQTTIPLVDASSFPNESGVVMIDNELISFTGKSGNTLTGCTRATSMINFLGGSQRTFTAGTAATHEYNTGVILVSNTISPIISHWGSAMLTDGQFDEDRGYIFNYAATNISVTTTKQTAFLIRLAPSVSNAIVGDLGDRELLNRAQLLLKGIEITADTGTGGIVIEGVLNPQNYPTNPSDIQWGGLQTAAQGGQPSFAQIAPGGSVVWSAGSQTTTAVTSLAFPTGSVTARGLSWRSNYSVQNGSPYIGITEADYNSYISSGLTTGNSISGTGIPANTTIAAIGNWYQDGALGRLYYIQMSQNGNANVSGNSTLTVTKSYSLRNTSTIYFQKASWESSGAKSGTEVSDTLFPANTFVSTASLVTYFSTQYYIVTFSQTSTSTAITAGTTTITFKFGQPPYALPGETVFSFIAAPATNSSLDLSELKELTNTTLGGRGTYPNGPDVLAINVYKATGAAINTNVVIRWGEAQA